MLLPRIPPSLRVVNGATSVVSRSTCPACSAIVRPTTGTFRSRSSPILSFVRNATHAAERRANGPKQGAGKRLGAKKTGEQYVIPGNIIFRQRGTNWHPGENVGMGRDHTIYATQPGYVKYYRNPALHPKRRYIGVVLNRNDVLPLPPNAARRRRLGMIAVPRRDTAIEESETEMLDGPPVTLPAAQPASLGEDGNDKLPRVKYNPFAGNPPARRDPASLPLRPGYQYREANWEIGRVADRAAVSPIAAERQRVRVHKFVRKDRFAALKAREKRAEQRAEKRRTMKPKGGKGKKGGRQAGRKQRRT